MSLARRNLVPELMDDPTLDARSHSQALRGLKRINRLSGTSVRIAHAIVELIEKHSLKSVRVLDVGCGSGDIAISIAERLARRVPDLPCHVVGWDMSSFAIERASSSAQQSSSVNDLQFEVRNILSTNEPGDTQSFDFAYCLLFLHHFSDEQAIAILNQLRQWVRCAFLVDDLLRTYMGHLLAKLGCHLLSRSPVVHFDGPQSVRAAFSELEIAALAERVPLSPVTIRKHWPERFMLTWERSSV